MMSIKKTLPVALLLLICLTKALQIEALDVEDSFFDAVNDVFSFTEETTLDSSGEEEDGDPFGIGGFFTGLLMVPFALVLLWKNEKKLVTYSKCMARAAKECITVDSKQLNEINDFKLVHVTGKTENKADIVDQDF